MNVKLRYRLTRKLATASITGSQILVPRPLGTSVRWEGNRRSGVALAMRHKQWYYHLWVTALGREMSTRPTQYTPVGV